MIASYFDWSRSRELTIKEMETGELELSVSNLHDTKERVSIVIPPFELVEMLKKLCVTPVQGKHFKRFEIR